jgi:hypothetical protein
VIEGRTCQFVYPADPVTWGHDQEARPSHYRLLRGSHLTCDESDPEAHPICGQAEDFCLLDLYPLFDPDRRHPDSVEAIRLQVLAYHELPPGF